MIVTLEMLRSKGACREQVETFEELFGSEVEVTVELAVRHAMVFDWGWGRTHLLSDEARGIYDAAMVHTLRADTQARDKAWADYTQAGGGAQHIYNQAAIEPWLGYNEAMDKARSAYNEAMDEARRAYAEGSARAFATAASA